MTKVYVAGPIRNPDVIKFLQNIKNGIQAAARLIGEGYAPFCPHLDYQYFFQWETSEAPDIKQIMAMSIEWLLQCNAVLVLPGWEESEGTRKELEIASLAQIPMFESISEIKECFKTNYEREVF